MLWYGTKEYLLIALLLWRNRSVGFSRRITFFAGVVVVMLIIRIVPRLFEYYLGVCLILRSSHCARNLMFNVKH